ncbi:MAG: N,N'-diacetylchitobiose phosphorylase [Alphaproteobacteria bacterium]|nr:N,N'-diacetylchitobiose phosphorylase [Alphaproteobacteria bacterium]
MQFGHFDDANKEYVITRPDTPRPWSNYLGSTEYGAIITNNAGGYSFYKSAAQGRFTRLRFNAVPPDQPGRYIYLRDLDSGDYWSASWQPVGKPLDAFKSECRHGSAYTTITSEYAGIRSETTYFVPLDRNLECWRVRLTNAGPAPRRLSAFTYVEYAGNWNAYNDLINLQYSQHIVKMAIHDGIIDHGTNVNIPPNPENFEDADQGRHSFLALVGAQIAGFDTDRAAFLGPYGTYARPRAVEQGNCTGSIAVGDNGCGVLQANIELAAGETKEFVVLMGVGSAREEGRRAVSEFGNPGKIDGELTKLKAYWHNRMAGLEATTPDPEFNSMLAMWSPFNCLMTFAWSRAASLIYAGERDGLGFRDTVQDMLGVMHMIPQEARDRLELMITGQVSGGGAMPVVKQFAHRPGHEQPPRSEEYRSDDCLWLFNAIPAYVKETGDLSFFRKPLPYADKGEDSVLGHMKRAIKFNLEQCGAHGLPCGLSADWNDCIRLGAEGESVFVAFQLRHALAVYQDICSRFGEEDEWAWARETLGVLDKRLHDHAWDGEWYLRAYRADGAKFGSRDNNEGKIFLSPQAWSVLSGHADAERGAIAMRSLGDKLATEHGLMLCHPAFVDADYRVMRAALFNPGMKENGSIFTHTQGWAIIAETMLGHGDEAWRYFRATLPGAWNDRAEIREIEPYVYCQFTHGRPSPRFGASRVPWLSGSAAWSYFAATQHILGIRPDYDGLWIDPCVPGAWARFDVTRRFRGKIVKITVRNPRGVQKGIRMVTLNGRPIEGSFLRAGDLRAQNDIVAEMG